VVNPLVLRLFELLLIRKRVSYFPEISTSFTRLLEESKNIARAQVRTAVPLDAELERKLQESLEGITGKKILLEKIVDKKLIGGVHVKIGDELLDSTIRTRLRDMKEQLLAVRVH
jgi:F-type H+-transporting ATPase subunit delta